VLGLAKSRSLCFCRGVTNGVLLSREGDEALLVSCSFRGFDL